MHWKIGEVIEARYASKLDEHLDELAFHYGEGALAGDAAKAAEFARRAGERALADLAFESAASHFERAIGSLELVDDASATERCDLLLAWADALVLSGDDRKRQAVFDAATIARETNDVGRLARAALVLVVRDGANQSVGNVDAELVALMEEALAALGPAPSSERARLLSSLAVELQHGADDARRTSLASEALAVAREIGDPVALGHVLLRSWAMVDGSQPWHTEFAALNAEAAEFAEATGNVDALRNTELFTFCMASMVGDQLEADAHLAAYVRLGDRSRRHDVRVNVQWKEAQQAVFAGELAEGERLDDRRAGAVHGCGDRPRERQRNARLAVLRDPPGAGSPRRADPGDRGPRDLTTRPAGVAAGAGGRVLRVRTLRRGSLALGLARRGRVRGAPT